MMKTRYIKHKNILGMNYENDCLFHLHAKHTSDKKTTLINMEFLSSFKFKEFLNLSKV